MRPHVGRIVKSGSMGKGTALKNSSDLDCILILNTIKDAEQLKANIRDYLAQIQSCLSEQPLRGQGWRFDIKRRTEYLLQFEMINFHVRKVTTVDLLPTFDANVTNGQARLNLYHKMASYDENTRSYCSAAVAELRRDFIIEKPTKLKGLIRLVKHWAKTYLPSSTASQRMPSSYLIELVTIHCWEKVGSPSSFNTASLFKNIMMAFLNHIQLNISWDRYYTLTQNPSPPTILDPANPYNKLYNDVNNWASVAQVARKTLQMPAMQV
ncbi:2'-5'-oligoadenylate synthase 1-like [Actinia tenebrosa]|uniref:2'-5'-oligoadenylate synthase 1-like n=1 Tax=Actinia tenebrosa TaxID=6105 RepID=A0A6P8IXH5_ACTTE|nr:2'-5'-oligoadenylate synthase 1-like [Actinia tenebrosa]